VRQNGQPTAIWSAPVATASLVRLTLIRSPIAFKPPKICCFSFLPHHYYGNSGTNNLRRTVSNDYRHH